MINNNGTLLTSEKGKKVVINYYRSMTYKKYVVIHYYKSMTCSERRSKKREKDDGREKRELGAERKKSKKGRQRSEQVW